MYELIGRNCEELGGGPKVHRFLKVTVECELDSQEGPSG